MTHSIFEITQLKRRHNRAGFRCGEAALDEYLRVYARQDVQCGAASVYVVLAPGSNDVLGFYSLSAASVELMDLQLALRKQLPKYGHVPAILLGRLAVHESAQDQKLGKYLLLDALHRSLESGIGWIVLMVQAKNEHAAAFYRHFEFQQFGNDPLVLYISRKTAATVCGHSD